MNVPKQAMFSDATSTSTTQVPLVSVVMPVYNGAQTLRSAIDSVLAQTLKDIEFIVVDDASTDDSPNIVRSYGNQIRFIQRSTNSGICEVARSQGLEIAQGRYSALIDQDDLWEPNKLELQVAFMETHPELLLSHTYAWVIDDKNIRSEIRHFGTIPPTGPCAHELLHHCFITISTLMVRGRAWLEAGNASTLRAANSDFLYFFSLLKKSPKGFGFIPEPLGSYRRGPQGMSRGRWKWGPEDVMALLALSRSQLWRGLVSRKDLRTAIRNACRTNTEHYYHQNALRYAAFFSSLGWRKNLFDFSFLVWLIKILLKSLLNFRRIPTVL